MHWEFEALLCAPNQMKLIFRIDNTGVARTIQSDKLGESFSPDEENK